MTVLPAPAPASPPDVGVLPTAPIPPGSPVPPGGLPGAGLPPGVPLPPEGLPGSPGVSPPVKTPASPPTVGVLPTAPIPPGSPVPPEGLPGAGLPPGVPLPPEGLPGLPLGPDGLPVLPGGFPPEGEIPSDGLPPGWFPPVNAPIGPDGKPIIDPINLAPTLDDWRGGINRLYSAAFGRTPDNEGRDYWVDIANDNLIDFVGIAEEFIQSPEGIQRFGPEVSDDVFINNLYEEILGRVPDQPGLVFWLDMLASEQMSHAQMLIDFANSSENIILVDTLL